MSDECIAESWEEPDDIEAGWFETAVEAEDVPNCWPIDPTHWMPLPAAPCATCNDQGAVGNILNAEPCPDCTPPASAQDDAKDERSDTYGMTLGERISHVGGRTNAQGYTEFGSPMAVNALIQHVLRDIDWTRQDDDGGYQARYRLPGGQWSSWGHVVCGVKGHEQELRYLPGARRPAAPAAGDAQTAAARDVLSERQRQISAENFSAERDDGYTNLELADAGAQYALRAGGWSSLNVWPWKPGTFKEGTAREMLVKAGALILAEIDRLDRAAHSASQQQEG
ncbi:hypothetical protein LMG7053_05923 [Achromobacter ruhlandii]|uniref:Uncharacterized protein n=2 Tax=Achromobacter ruhlandii TaxID=72557 RepID=A0ABM8M3Q3_9BURK|nr:hypothetical protein LMG7053_05923 [Achromobacter ruhlandii]